MQNKSDAKTENEEQEKKVDHRVQTFLQKFADDDIPVVATISDFGKGVKDWICEKPKIKKLKKEFEKSGIPATAHGLNALLDDTESSISKLFDLTDEFAQITGQPVPLLSNIFGQSNPDDNNSSNVLQSILQSGGLKTWLFSKENKIAFGKSVVMPALKTLLPAMHLSATLAPAVVGVALLAVGAVKIHEMQKNRRERQKDDNIYRHVDRDGRPIHVDRPIRQSRHTKKGVREVVGRESIEKLKQTNGSWSSSKGFSGLTMSHEHANVRDLQETIHGFSEDIDDLKEDISKLRKDVEERQDEFNKYLEDNNNQLISDAQQYCQNAVSALDDVLIKLSQIKSLLVDYIHTI